MKKYKICVFTGSRAEYGLFYPLLKKIESDIFFELQIICTGMHMCPEFGLTYKEIEENGFIINDKIEMLLSSDTEVAIAKSVGLGLLSFIDALKKLKSDFVVLLGDRFEIFSAAAASFFLKIPIIHIHGGEITEGALDDALRHSITKMSLLHFTSCEEYRKRVIQLGEQPANVFNTGALGIDNIVNLKLLNKTQIKNNLNITFDKPTILVTYHPVTLENNTAALQFANLIKAIDSSQNYNIIFTKPNADAGGRIIIKMIDAYVAQNPQKAKAFVSLGFKNYLSVLQFTEFVIGNSSSGIIEVPYFKIPTINIGDRQKGRVKPSTVIDCESNYKSIKKAIIKAADSDFRRECKKINNIYGNGQAAENIVNILKRKIKAGLSLKKSFFNINFNI